MLLHTTKQKKQGGGGFVNRTSNTSDNASLNNHQVPDIYHRTYLQKKILQARNVEN
jgi:hypothetical protein